MYLFNYNIILLHHYVWWQLCNWILNKQHRDLINGLQEVQACLLSQCKHVLTGKKLKILTSHGWSHAPIKGYFIILLYMYKADECYIKHITVCYNYIIVEPLEPVLDIPQQTLPCCTLGTSIHRFHSDLNPVHAIIEHNYNFTVC